MPVLQCCSLFIQWTWLASELLALEVQKKGLLRQKFRYWFVVLFHVAQRQLHVLVSAILVTYGRI